MKAIACALLLGAFMLSSCQGQAAEPKPKSEATKTAPANPEATLPPMPAAANEFTPAGASAFVRHYVEVLEYASKTGDVTELRRLSRKSCEGCNEYIRYFGDLYEGGGFARGSNWSAGENELRYQSQQGYESLVTTDLAITAGRGRDDSKSEVKQYAKSKDKVTFGLIFENGWTINQFAYGGVE